MASISSLGIGSGIDISSIVTKLVEAERVPKLNRLNRQETDIQAKISALGSLKNSVADFRASYLALKLASTYSKVSATSSNTNAFTAKVNNSAALGSHTVEVTQIAKGEILTLDAAYAAPDMTTTSVGTGTLTFEFDTNADSVFDGTGTTHSVTISNGTLAGIRDAVNSANIGVSASIINNGSGYQLSFTTNTGLRNSVKISAADALGTPVTNPATGLGRFAYDPMAPVGAGQNMVQQQTAQNAIVIFDGVSISNSNNIITNPVAGVTLNLVNAAIGSPGTLTISADNEGITNSVTHFVESLNKLVKNIDGLTFYNSKSGDKGIFQGDAMVRNLESRIRGALSRSVGDFRTPYNSLASIGISTEKDGTFTFDSSKLSAALTTSRDQVRDLFAGNLSAIESRFASDLTFSTVPAGVNTNNVDVNISHAATQASISGNNVSSVFSPYLVGGALTARPDFSLDSSYDFSMTVGGQAVNLNFPAPGTPVVFSGLNMGQDLALYLQSQINSQLVGGTSVAVSYQNGFFSISNNAYGSASSLQVTAATNAPTLLSGLGLSTTTLQAGTDVRGTIGHLSATGTGQSLVAGAGSTYTGLTATYTGSITSAEISRQKKGGLLEGLDEILTELLDSKGSFTSRIDSFNNQVDSISEQRVKLDLRISSLEARLVKQFSTMDAMVAQLNATGEYLGNQLKSLQGLNAK